MSNVPQWYINGQNPWYVPGKFLGVGRGNNAFSLPKKPDRNRLEITPLKVGGLDELRLGNHVAFQDFEGEEWLECRGLESGILCLDYSVPIYVFDNHNHVFYAWAEALKMGWFQKGATLVHMDEHFDDSEPPREVIASAARQSLDRSNEVLEELKIASFLAMTNLEHVWNYTNEVLQIATYIKPALQLGIFKECVNYVETQDFASLRNLDDVVLNLDIDVFHEDMSHISWQQKIDVLKHYLSRTKLITIATSPYFIDQQRAIGLVKRVVGELF